jgi:hypothetical protein
MEPKQKLIPHPTLSLGKEEKGPRGAEHDGARDNDQSHFDCSNASSVLRKRL